MKSTFFLLGCYMAATLSTTALASLELQIAPAYVREHPKEWSVKVAKKENGLIAFTIVRSLSEPKYLVARISRAFGVPFSQLVAAAENRL